MVCGRMIVSRTRDMDLVKQLWGDPSIYSQMCDDGCPDDSSEWYPADSDKRYFLVPWLIAADQKTPMGIIAYYAMSHVMYEVHIGLLPAFQHQDTTTIGHLANEWIFTHTPCEKILAFVPVTKPHVKRLAEKCGFKKQAYLKHSFLSKGTLIDQWLLSLGRKYYGRNFRRRG